MRYRTGILIVFSMLNTLPPTSAAERPMVEAFLHQGKLREGETALVERLKQAPGDDQARFGLGALQFIRAIEHLGQSLYRYGTGINTPAAREIPFLRLPVPPNPKPEKLTYELARKIFEDLIADFAKAEATLAGIKDEGVVLRLQLGPTRLDFDGDGKADDPFDVILARYTGGRNAQPRPGDSEVAFDRGDVVWLRGYCHLLSALCEFLLAHDGRELFAHTAHLFFANADTPYRLFSSEDVGAGQQGFYNSILDVVAFVHLLRLPVIEPKRMQAALAHFEQVFALSRASWKFILAETDDEREWLPNPGQKDGALGMPIRQDQIDGWLAFIDEAEALFAGKRLAPFWRGGTRGINLRRVFTEPRTFDLVLWIQGSAAVPYLEEGPLTRPEVWDRLSRVFGGEFFGFALWFN